MTRAILLTLALLGLTAAGALWAQNAKAPEYTEPPEEDQNLSTSKVYTFNPLQAKKEIETGDFYTKRGNHQGAALRYREATLWDEGNAEAFYKWGEASEKLKDFESAREAFAKYVKLVDDKKKVADVNKRVAKYPREHKVLEPPKLDPKVFSK